MSSLEFFICSKRRNDKKFQHYNAEDFFFSRFLLKRCGKINKNILYIILIIVFSYSVFSTLIFEEDFQDYTLNNKTWHLEDNSETFQWMCSDFALDSCQNQVGVCVNGVSFSQIISDGGNRVLEVFGNCTDNQANYKEVSIMRNYTIPCSQCNFSLSYDVRFVSVDWFNIGFNNATKTEFSSFVRPFNLDYTSFGGGFDYTSIVMGGNTAIGEDNFLRLRAVYSEIPHGGYPASSSCDVNDGLWHNVIWNLKANGSFYYDTDIYVDGVHCLDFNESSNSVFGAGTGYFYITSKGGYNVYYDNIEFYYDELTNYSESVFEDSLNLDCPIDNCIFYDDFSKYGDYGNISEGDWSYYEDNPAIIIDDKLYFNKSETWMIINHDINDKNYDTVYYNIEIETNNTQTPSGLNITDENFLGYRVLSYCGDNIGFVYNIYMFQDISWSRSDNSTIYNIYTTDGGDLRQLGTLTLENNQKFIMSNKLDLENQKASLDYVEYSVVLNEFVPISSFEVDLLTSCSGISKIELERLGRSEDKFYAGINKVYLYGENKIEDSSVIFVNEDEVEVNESLIKVNVDEKLHNAANTLGFRTTAGKLGFWFLIMFFFIFLLLNSDTDSSVKKYGSFLIFIIMIVLGKYFNFVPTVFLAFVILLIAIIGALTYNKVFAQND